MLGGTLRHFALSFYESWVLDFCIFVGYHNSYIDSFILRVYKEIHVKSEVP